MLISQRIQLIWVAMIFACLCCWISAAAVARSTRNSTVSAVPLIKSNSNFILSENEFPVEKKAKHKKKHRRLPYFDRIKYHSVIARATESHRFTSHLNSSNIDEHPNDDEEVDMVEEYSPTSFDFWLRLLIVLGLLLVAALMSGLTIGLMSLDMNNLYILKLSGSPEQRRNAALVEPLRRRGHLLLCTLLIGNMLANETIPIVLDQLVEGGWLAVIISTALIVLFGEIIPQAICSRYGLAIGAKAAWLVKLLMILFFPIAWPISALLTKLLGNHEGIIYKRSELKEFVTLHGEQAMGELTADEVCIIKSVLDLKSKKVNEVMTPINDVFMLDVDTILNRRTLRMINETGFSRIPIFASDRQNILGILLVKRLLALNLEMLCRLRDIYSYAVSPILMVSHEIQLFELLNQFQEGRAHMAAVAYQPSNTFKQSQDSKMTNNIIGIITLEDVIEEIVGEEIVDETDVYIDVRTRKLRPCDDAKETKRKDARPPLHPSSSSSASRTHRRRNHLYPRFRNGSKPIIRKYKSPSRHSLSGASCSSSGTWSGNTKSRSGSLSEFYSVSQDGHTSMASGSILKSAQNEACVGSTSAHQSDSGASSDDETRPLTDDRQNK